MRAMSSADPTSPFQLADTGAARQLVGEVLALAAARGARQAEAAVSLASALSATVRMGEVDTVEHHRDKGLGVTVYFDHRKGSASTSEFSAAAVAKAVEAACDIARATSADPCAGLADAEMMAREVPDLDLCHPWEIEAKDAIAIALACENAARASDPRIRNSEGATVSRRNSSSAYGNSHGFTGAWLATSHSVSCTAIAEEGDSRQRDFWYSVARRPLDLESPEAIGRRAAERAIARLGARAIGTVTVPVIFEARAATSLFGHFVAAVSGGNLYRKASFLVDALGEQVFAPHVTIDEQPHIPRGIGSAPFDNDGVATRTRHLVEGGVLRSYVLGAYSARKLGMQTTGNAGGVHNLTVAGGSARLDALMREAGTGLLVAELMGFGVNTVTGDYSRGASGFWFEGGEIRQAVEEVTIAGNLRDMFRGIIAIGNDLDLRGNIRTGSVLIDRMTVAGR
jgi:PmbA protein